ncbi:MAG: chromosomal replication initiator protein DnaA [Oscillospiraceae bacterium]|nr:chromosomal replication initiator protein DnaA [Oscillospiraceae bacterium]
MDSFTEIWEMVRQALKESVSEITYNVWLADLELAEFDEDHAVLLASAFKKPLLEKKFMDILEAAFRRVLGFSVPITIVVDGADAQAKAPQLHTNTSPLILQTFDTFVVGSSNKFAHAAAVSVAEKPGKVYNPLFIYGNSGLGKTHLMQAILFQIQSAKPNVRAIATSGEAFANELIRHIYQQNMDTFHNKYRSLDVLLVDDVQFIGGKESTQEEFFHTFNEVTNSGGQIVLVSDRPPKEIATLDERLRTRFEMGLIADIQPPDFETRVAIVKRKAADLNTCFPEEIASFIADKLRNNVRQLEGAARRLQAYIVLNGMEPTRAAAELAIRDILEEYAPPAVTLERIVEEISRAFAGSAEDIRGKKRDAKTVMMRQAAIYCARQVTSLSMQQIGKEFGRDHSTVMYSLKQMDTEMKRNAQVRAIINDVLSNIRD